MKPIVIVSGPSGVGKTVLVEKFLEEHQDWHYPISTTTRKPRYGEIGGKDYYFVSIEDFQKRIRNEEFFEWVEVHGNLYGTLKAEMDKECTGLLIIADTQGCEKFKHTIECVSVFIKPDRIETLEERMAKRGDSQDTISLRLTNAIKELEKIPEYDYCITNDDFMTAYNALSNVILAQIYKRKL